MSFADTYLQSLHWSFFFFAFPSCLLHFESLFLFCFVLRKIYSRCFWPLASAWIYFSTAAFKSAVSFFTCSSGFFACCRHLKISNVIRWWNIFPSKLTIYKRPSCPYATLWAIWSLNSCQERSFSNHPYNLLSIPIMTAWSFCPAVIFYPFWLPFFTNAYWASSNFQALADLSSTIHNESLDADIHDTLRSPLSFSEALLA